jgi:class 3 adenylate cyclase
MGRTENRTSSSASPRTRTPERWSSGRATACCSPSSGPERPPGRGFHDGPVVFRKGDYFGRTVNIAARIGDSARPGEVVVGQEVADAAEEAPVRFTEIGPVEPRGISGAFRLHTAHSSG